MEIISNDSFMKNLSNYYDILKEEMPDLISNVNVINDEIFYFIQLFFLNKDKIEIDYNYETKFDKYSIILEVSKILKNINPSYQEKYEEYLKNRKIVFGRFKKSCTDGKKIYIKNRNNIEDIATMIHEFFHYEHLSKYEFDMDNSDWCFLTEMIAITFEAYALLKLYNENQFKNDIKNYFLKITYSVYSKADGISIEAMCLNMYDKYKNVDTEAFLKYQKAKQVPEEFGNLINKFIEKKHKFEYHEEATYIYAFPLAIFMAVRMNEDSNYFNKVMNTFNNINQLSVEDILKEFELSNILSSDNNYDNLYQAMIKIEEFINILNENKDIKEIGVK